MENSPEYMPTISGLISTGLKSCGGGGETRGEGEMGWMDNKPLVVVVFER